MALRPTFDHERTLWNQGLRLVAGVDEVGRGPLAGPVVAAAVVLPPRARFAWLDDVRDSKMLLAPKREELAEKIRAKALAVGLGIVPPERIDAIGIAPAGRLAMAEALAALTPAPNMPSSTPSPSRKSTSRTTASPTATPSPSPSPPHP